MASLYVPYVITGSAADIQAIGLALSLRRLDLLETFYIASRAPSDPSSSEQSKQVLHDESMLRYVLNEAISGTSGNENWPIDFRADVRPLLSLVISMLNGAAFQDSTTTIPTKSRTRLEQYDDHLGSIACGRTYC